MLPGMRAQRLLGEFPGQQRPPAGPGPAGMYLGCDLALWIGRKGGEGRRQNVRPPCCTDGGRQQRRPTMGSALYDPSVKVARADALFVSVLQRSDEPSAGQV